jgi:hypothetical protein
MARISRSVIEALEKFIETRRDPDREVPHGEFSPLEDDLTAYLEENPQANLARSKARQVIADYFDTREQPEKNDQGILFTEDLYYSLGEGRSIRAADARKAHVGLKIQVRSEAHRREVSDYSEDMNFLMARFFAFADDNERQIQVEIREFGYRCGGEPGEEKAG